MTSSGMWGGQCEARVPRGKNQESAGRKLQAKVMRFVNTELWEKK